jgi:hypothetical protein
LVVQGFSGKQYNAGDFHWRFSFPVFHPDAKGKADMKYLLAAVGGVNKTLYFIFLCLSSIALTYAGKTLLISEDLYFQFFGDQLSYERIAQIISKQEKWEWTSYVFVPIYYVVKIFLVGICIYIGTTIIAIDISFKKICQLALLAEAVFLIPGIFKLFWFIFIQTNYTLSDIQTFYPLSILNFFDPYSLDVWLIYPLQLINIFEVAYSLILAYGLFLVTQTSYMKMLSLIVCTYGTGLFIWTISVMFLTISFSA